VKLFPFYTVVHKLSMKIGFSYTLLQCKALSVTSQRMLNPDTHLQEEFGNTSEVQILLQWLFLSRFIRELMR